MCATVVALVQVVGRVAVLLEAEDSVGLSSQSQVDFGVRHGNNVGKLLVRASRGNEKEIILHCALAFGSGVGHNVIRPWIAGYRQYPTSRNLEFGHLVYIDIPPENLLTASPIRVVFILQARTSRETSKMTKTQKMAASIDRAILAYEVSQVVNAAALWERNAKRQIMAHRIDPDFRTNAAWQDATGFRQYNA